MLYFIQDIMKMEDPQMWAAFNVACSMAAGIPTGILAGRLSDKYGRKIILYCSCTLMGLSSVWLIVLTYRPDVVSFLISAALFGIGYGAYRAVDWALALDVLPSGSQIAKDMGIWHVALVLPRVISPLISGFILRMYEEDKITGYLIVFSLSIFWILFSIIFVYFITVPPKHQHNPTFAENSPIIIKEDDQQ